MDVMEIKRKQIYKIIEDPTLTKDQKVDKVAKIISKTDEEVLRDYQDKEPKLTLEDIYRSLFPKKGEGEENENKKTK